jgi:hypothetical protein
MYNPTPPFLSKKVKTLVYTIRHPQIGLTYDLLRSDPYHEISAG